MKITLTVINLLLGGLLLMINFQPYNFTAGNAIGLIWGLATIVGSIAFIRKNPYGFWTLPVTSLLLAIYAFFVAADPNAGLVAGVAALEGIIFFVIFLIQAAYVLLKRHQYLDTA